MNQATNQASGSVIQDVNWALFVNAKRGRRGCS